MGSGNRATSSWIYSALLAACLGTAGAASPKALAEGSLYGDHDLYGVYDSASGEWSWTFTETVTYQMGDLGAQLAMDVPYPAGRSVEDTLTLGTVDIGLNQTLNALQVTEGIRLSVSRAPVYYIDFDIAW